MEMKEIRFEPKREYAENEILSNKNLESWSKKYPEETHFSEQFDEFFYQVITHKKNDSSKILTKEEVEIRIYYFPDFLKKAQEKLFTNSKELEDIRLGLISKDTFLVYITLNEFVYRIIFDVSVDFYPIKTFEIFRIEQKDSL